MQTKARLDELIGENVRLAREAAGLYQDDLAKALDVSRPTIADIERGKRRLTYAEGLMLQDLLGVETFREPVELLHPADKLLMQTTGTVVYLENATVELDKWARELNACCAELETDLIPDINNLLNLLADPDRTLVGKDPKERAELFDKCTALMVRVRKALANALRAVISTKELFEHWS